MNYECLQMNEILAALYGTKNKKEAFKNTLEILKKTISFDRGDIYFYDDSGEHPEIKVFIPVGWPPDELDEYLNEYYRIDDVLPLISSKKSIMFRSSDIFSLENNSESENYLRALKPFGVEYSIEGSICCVGDIIGGIGLHRGKEAGEFTYDDVEFMKMLSVHLRNVATDYVTAEDDLPQVACLNGNFFISYVLWDSNYSIEWENLDNIGINNVHKSALINKMFMMSRKLNGNKSITKSISIEKSNDGKSDIKNRDYLVTINKVMHNSKYCFCATILDFNRIMDEAFDSLQDTINLTKREMEIIRLAMNGLDTADIAKAFYVDVSTVKKHLTNSYQKMGIKGKHQIINFLLKGGNDRED